MLVSNGEKQVGSLTILSKQDLEINHFSSSSAFHEQSFCKLTNPSCQPVLIQVVKSKTKVFDVLFL